MTLAVAPPPALVAPRRLRDYQAEAVEAIDAEWAAGNARTAAVLATGLGKTDVIADKAVTEARRGGRVLVLAHRSELLDQITARCGMHDPTIPVGRVQAGRHSARAPIVVAMEPTLRRASRRARMVRPTLVIVDECHHAASDGYLGVLRWAGCFDEQSPTRLLGVTATLVREDKRGLGDVFLSVAITRDIAWAVTHGPHSDDPTRSVPVGDGPGEAEDGWLVRPRGKVVVGEHLDLDKAKVRGGDYVEAELGELVAQDVDHIVDAWLEHASDRLTMASVPTVASAQALAEAFRARGVTTGEVYGTTPHGERQRIYADVAAGVRRVLVGVGVLTEGFDLPELSCVLMARPTKRRGLYAQIVGRGLRRHPSKSDCLVLDVVGSSRTLGLATLAELLPSAEIDDVELDVQPCAACEGYSCRKPAAVALAESRGMAPCSCRCEDCRELHADCTCGQGPAPDAGRRKLVGRAVYAEVDLLGLADDTGPAGSLNWLVNGHGDVFCAVGDRFVVLAELGGGAWAAASVAKWGRLDAQPIREGLSLPSTKVEVQRWVDRQVAAGVEVHGRGRAWRTKGAAPTEKQLAAARRLGIVDPESYTRGALSDLMDVERCTRQLAP